MRTAGSRYEPARMLAVMPTAEIGERYLAEAHALANRIARSARQAPVVAMNVGTPVAGRQMVLRAKPQQLELPETPEQAAAFLVRRTPGQLGVTSDAGTQRMAEVDFGWIKEGDDPTDYMTRVDFDGPSRPETRRQVQEQQIAHQIQAATPELLDRFGLQPGDLLYNTPVGTNQGDYRRAKGYLRSGFGSPSYDNEQFALLNKDGSYSPWQPFGGHPGVGADLGWDVPLTPEQAYQWERRLATIEERKQREAAGLIKPMAREIW